MNEIEHIKWVREHPQHYDRQAINVILNKLYRAKEIIGAHHADLKPSEKAFFDELERAFS